MRAYLLIAIAALGLSACNTVEGVGQDIQEGGKALERAAN